MTRTNLSGWLAQNRKRGVGRPDVTVGLRSAPRPRVGSGKAGNMSIFVKMKAKGFRRCPGFLCATGNRSRSAIHAT